MEMIGLVVIVILITLGMLFMAYFGLKEDPTKKVFVRKGLAYSAMSSLLNTNVFDTQCGSGSGALTSPQLGKDLLEDCAVNYQSVPDGYSLYKCGNKHSCVYLKEELIPHLLNASLGAWNKRYEFHSNVIIAGTSKELMVIKNKGGCSGKERDSSGEFFINTDTGMVASWLYLCD
jgi:hypothetical protein